MNDQPDRIPMTGGAVKTEMKVAEGRSVKLVRGREIPPEGYGRTALHFKCPALLGLKLILDQWITGDGRVRDPDEMLAEKPVQEWVQHVLGEAAPLVVPEGRSE